MRKRTTLVATRATTAVAASGTASYGSLGLDIALGGAGRGLVHGLNGDVGLGFTLLVVAYIRDASRHGQQLVQGRERDISRLWVGTRSNRRATRLDMGGSEAGIAGVDCTEVGESVLRGGAHGLVCHVFDGKRESKAPATKKTLFRAQCCASRAAKKPRLLSCCSTNGN